MSSPASRSRWAGQLLVIALAVLALLLALAFVRWGWQRSTAEVRADTLSSRVLDDSRVEVIFEVFADADARLECEVRAKAPDTLDVGGVTTTVEPGPDRRRQIDVIVPTRRPAAYGQVVSCRSVDV